MTDQKRVTVTHRLSPGGLEAIDGIVEETRVRRSDVLRVCLAVAMKHRAEVVAMIRSLKEVG